MNEKKIIKLEFHKARNTPAETKWYVVKDDKVMSLLEAQSQDLIKHIFTTSSFYKTHVYCYYIVKDENIKLMKIRISNRGNVHKTIYDIKALEISEDEKETIKYANEDFPMFLFEMGG